MNRTFLLASAAASLLGAVAGPALAASWPSGFTHCANERATCVVGSSLRQVSYGARDKWTIKNLAGTVTCNNATFGDPVPGTRKYCAIGPVVATASQGPALTVDAAADQRAISPYIYGMNYATEALAADLRLPVRRLGGNQTTRYNWKIDVSNRGSDWFFENIPEEIMNGGVSDPKNLPDASSANRFIEQDRRTGTKTLLTMPMSGWVAKRRTANSNHPFDCGFKVSLYGNQQSTDTWDTDCGNGKRADGSNVTGNKPEDTSLAIGPEFVQEWLRYLTRRYGTADAGGVRFVNLDNEPELWRHTHRDVRPQALGYDELRDRTIQYAAAIKAVDKSVQTLGPAGWGWHAYFYSDKDTLTTNFWDNPLDRNAHGGVPLTDWYLQQLSAYEKSNGVRLLDYLDHHFYPQATGVLDNKTDAATNALRLRQTRVLWDASYVDESWIGQPVRLIPRMREWIGKNYPGTKIAMSEYNFGALNHINGALAQADILGIFGREGLDLATLWNPPAANEPGAYAFRMYRNYDGAGSAFGETSVKATSADQGKLAVYAARQAVGGALTLMVINKTDQNLSTPLTVADFSPAATGKTYRYSSANLAAIVRGDDVAVTNRSFTAHYPANSITLVWLPAAGSQ